MHFLLTKLGPGSARWALGRTLINYSQVSGLSSQNITWPVVHRNRLALCYNCDKRRSSSLLEYRQYHVAHANPNVLEENVEVNQERFPTPVQDLKALNKLMQDKFDMSPIFSVSSSFLTPSNVNKVELTLNWPETRTFTASATEKKMALRKTCREALQWLYDNKHITKAIRPIMIYETSRMNTVEVNLNQSVVNELDSVLDIYAKDVVPALSKFDRTWHYYDVEKANLHPTLGGPFPSSEDLDRWNQTLKPTKHRELKLPIDDYREDILQAIKNNAVTLVKGATGCGKTTKVPQFILDEAIAEGRGAYCNIAVCLPRRLTAKETAKFVAHSRRETVGQSVGYNVRMERKGPSVLGGSIVFMTGQKLALKFSSNQLLRGVSHVVLDEVHLRDVGTDLVMNLLRQALQENKDLRVIIMSATVDTDVLQSYFSSFGPMPIIEVPGRIFPVQAHYLNDLPAVFYDHTKSLSINNAEIDLNLAQRVITWIHNTKPNGGILVFISGWTDIAQLTQLLSPIQGLKVVPVHRRLGDHSAALKPAPKGLRKVILATNVAETSITFPDIVYVVDCGIHKICKRNQISRGRWASEDMSSTWISKANVVQRRGRAGRVRPGECYHLFTEEIFNQMDDHESPHILNSSLESVVMMAKVVNPKIKAVALLGEFPQPPSQKDISEAVTTLQELSFLSHHDETPTALGVAAMKMSAPLPAASAMIQSAILRCSDTMVSVLASAEQSPIKFCGASEERKLKADHHDSSDHLAQAKAISGSHFSRTKNLNFFLSQMVKSQNEFLKRTDLNEHDSEMLVKSILLNCYGSLLVRVKTPFSQYMNDSSGKSAIITTRSVNYNIENMDFPFAMYLTGQGKEKMIFVDDTSTISPLSVLLFSPSDLRTEDVDSDTIHVRAWRNRYVKLVLSKENYTRIKNLRSSLKDVLEYFVITEMMNYPDENYNLMCRFRTDLLSCINNLLSIELAQETDL
ncbi:ATP-dependent RNA helicase DHX30-like [Thrips palmi]|uniref:ATP-dependent RNA helicase DHX30-like n=1 Tax=Thrips palmi TaxID=161013 RepID=A0A6P8YQ57_THRPL|nr:ATP-dependent RNA helicase DHX30-like [Thrips palmi]